MINYKHIADSIEYYSALGFQRVETPWTVTDKIAGITTPDNKSSLRLIHNDNKVLVSSGEQSFLYQYSKGFLPKGRFQTVTPCFRSDSFDESHQKYFIKNELIVTDEVSLHSLHVMVAQAFSFFFGYSRNVFLEKTSELSYDINLEFDDQKIELGSYGIRKCGFMEWVYGTGVAEPRLSYALEKYELSH